MLLEVSSAPWYDGGVTEVLNVGSLAGLSPYFPHPKDGYSSAGFVLGLSRKVDQSLGWVLPSCSSNLTLHVLPPLRSPRAGCPTLLPVGTGS